MLRRLFSTIMLAVAAGTLSPAATAVASPHSRGGQGFGVRLVDVPVDEARNPRALRYIIDYLPTGTVIHRRIFIMNAEPGKAHFTVYPDAATISGGLFTGDGGETRSELTGWISVQHPSVTLGPESSVTDMITIKVPPGATRGEHYAVIWVQQEAYARASGGVGVNEISRVGVRVYLAVGRGGAPPTAFAIESVTGHRSASGQPSISAKVDNTGQRAIDVSGTVRLADGPGNTSAGPFRSQQIITLAPGQSGTMTFALPKTLPTGPWRATVAMVSGLTRRTTTATVQLSALQTAQAGLPGLAWVGLAVAVLAFMLAVAAVALRRRRQPS
jgi:hypothetical protein